MDRNLQRLPILVLQIPLGIPLGHPNLPSLLYIQEASSHLYIFKTHGPPDGKRVITGKLYYDLFSRCGPSKYKEYNPILPTCRYRKKNNRCDLTFIKVSSLIAPLLDDTELISLSSCSLHLLYQILTSTYQLLNDTLPGCFRDCWFCVPPRPNL